MLTNEEISKALGASFHYKVDPVGGGVFGALQAAAEHNIRTPTKYSDERVPKDYENTDAQCTVKPHPKKETNMRIFIASPLRADSEAQYKINQDRAKIACREASLAGHAPFAPHLFYTQFLNDSVPTERTAGIEAGLAFLAICDEVWAYGPISLGMALEIEEANRLKIPVITKSF